MGFTKLDERIIQSSIMAESPETFKVWITLLALCKNDGIAECSSSFLEAICRISPEKIDEAINILSSPDKKSRSLNDDGKRIERVDGGFKVLNYEKYRTESLRSAEAERKRLYRINKCPDSPGQCPDTSASVSDINSINCIKDGVQGEKQKPTNKFIIPDYLKDIWPAFEEMRKGIKKPLTDRAKQLTINDLDKLSNNEAEKIAILEQSIQRSWQGVFALNDRNIKNNGGSSVWIKQAEPGKYDKIDREGKS